MRVVYLKRTALATEPVKLLAEIEALESEVKRVRSALTYNERHFQEIKVSLKRSLNSLEGLTAGLTSSAQTAQTYAKNRQTEIMQRQVELEEALERTEREIETQRGDLEVLEASLAEKQTKMQAYVAVQVAD